MSDQFWVSPGAPGAPTTSMAEEGEEMAQFRLRASEDRTRWCWLLVAGGKVLAVSEMYAAREDAIRAIEAVRKATQKASLVEAEELPTLEATG